MLRRRARQSGRSIQSYVREQLVEIADEPTADEAVAAVEAALARHGGGSATAVDVVEAVHDGRP